MRQETSLDCVIVRQTKQLQKVSNIENNHRLLPMISDTQNDRQTDTEFYYY